MMLKNYKKTLIITSLIILLPVLFGLICWNRLPDMMNIHWNANGSADGMGSKVVAVCMLPCIMLAVHWLCVVITMWDNRKTGQNKKIYALTMWILPVISVVVSAGIYASALGWEYNMIALMAISMGIVFMIIGNYMPKCRQNRTMGIKITWTLASEENWNATHRVGGKVWFIGGLLMLPMAYLPGEAMMCALLAITAVMVLIPVVYSWMYYKKQVAEGQELKTNIKPMGKNAKKTSLATLILTLGIVGVILFTGSISVIFEDDAFTIEASYWKDITVEYASIDSIEYREEFDAGRRVNGYGSPRLSIGAFENSEFGRYTIYAHNTCESCIVIKVDDNILVVNGEDEAATKQIYDEISAR